jgi:hypothetical protein
VRLEVSAGLRFRMLGLEIREIICVGASDVLVHRKALFAEGDTAFFWFERKLISQLLAAAPATTARELSAQLKAGRAAFRVRNPYQVAVSCAVVNYCPPSLLVKVEDVGPSRTQILLPPNMDDLLPERPEKPGISADV